MEELRAVDVGHQDLIHDAVYNFYGNRMATCSSDHVVKVWNRTDAGAWVLSGEIKEAHHGSIWRVSWAHPEFGQVLATCSFDHTAAIWEEMEEGNWQRRAEIVDSRSSVTCVQFAPRHAGLKLAACTDDGTVRVYEAIDVMNLSSWPPTTGGEFKTRGKGKCTCLSWNPSRMLSGMMLAVGCANADSATNNIQVWEYEESKRWSLAIDSIASVEGRVRDVAFAPNMGRSFHLLAAACGDKTLRIWKLSPTNASKEAASPKYRCEEILKSDPFNDQVARVSWNVTGTMLACSSDDGTVRLWKATYMDSWQCVATINGQ